jgi:hypothetical protein
VSKVKTRSGFEDSLVKTLKTFVKKVGYEVSKLAYKVFLERNYIPDFTLEKKDGSFMYIEAKGRFTVEDRKKMLLVKEQHPDKDIRLLFQSDNWLTKLTPSQKKKLKSNLLISKLRYSGWAEKHGFKYAISKKNKDDDSWSFPKEWLKELKRK